MKPTEPSYMDLKGASAYSAMSVPALRNHIASGSLPCFKVGGKWLIKVSELDAWIEGFRVNNASDCTSIIDDIMSAINVVD